ncbi:hypothetical protein CANINC_004023 [Pichia inconspicua]|uniref:Phospholipid/glycerol acyltransferase domain-containing protein n=1 Tax=Pichia inconspicua TaxID=52247 RepID=A0A4V6TTQ0_9ASCO|nr:hypothetical protein CANINC_004023 [[Candida] inconspicua]
MHLFLVNIVGDRIENENAVIISNHKSIVDHVIVPLLTRKTLTQTEEQLLDSDSEDDEKKIIKKDVKTGRKIRFKILQNEEAVFAKDLSTILIPKVTFFTWYKLWSIPSIDYFKHISQADENWEMDGETLVSTFHNFLDIPSLNLTQWVVTFPEVNMFTEKDLRMQNILGEKHYLPPFEHVLYPRFGNFANVIGGLYKTKYTRLYDLTLIYYNRDKRTGKIIDFKPPSLLSILGVRDPNIETVILVHIAGKFFSHVPLKRNKLEKYLESRWMKKDRLIAKLEKRILKENSKLVDV